MASELERLQSMRAKLESVHEYLPRLGVAVGVGVERLPIVDILDSGTNSGSGFGSEGEMGTTDSGSRSGSGKSTPSHDENEDEDDNESSPSPGRGVLTGRKERASASAPAPLRYPHAGPGGVPGLRGFRENVRSDIEQIDKFLARYALHRTTVSPSAFSTNAPYIIAVWNELVRAQRPVLFVDKTFPAPIQLEKTKGTEGEGNGNGGGAGKRPVSPQITFSRRGVIGTKVDVVADAGRVWVRVNTIKNSRLLAEFRELDSYLTDSETSSESEDGGSNVDTLKFDSVTSASKMTAKSAPSKLDNSLLQMSKSLVSAARTSVAASDSEDAEARNSRTPPKVVLRLTRLLLDGESSVELEKLGLRIIGPRERSVTSDPKELDPRIAQTLLELLELGIAVVLGEYDFEIPLSLQGPPPKSLAKLVPSRQINLDLSVLIALISDITHAPLPETEEEARRRYIPTEAERERSKKRREMQKEKEVLARVKKAKEKPQSGNKLSKEKGRMNVEGDDNDGGEGDGLGESVHSRALAGQVLREIELSLLSEISGRLSAARDGESSPPEFWTSREARDRCLRIVSKIGGPSEKRRAAALFFDPSASGKTKEVLGAMYGYVSPEHAADAYWRESRHERGLVPGLVPVRVFEEDGERIPLVGSEKMKSGAGIGEGKMHENPFWRNLECACARLLSSGEASHPHSLASASAETGGNNNNTDQSEEIKRASVTKLNPRLTTHTVSTLHRGARNGWTTLTANRASVREVAKECAKEVQVQVQGGAGAVGSLEGDLVGRVKTLNLLDEKPEDDGKGEGKDGEEEEVAAIWVVEPRSLADSMRSDYVPA